MSEIVPQWRVAMEKADAVRIARAALKRSIKSGEIDVHDFLEEEIPEEMKKMLVYDLLKAIPRMGDSRIKTLLQRSRSARC
jgi:hypothetical protein